MIRKIGLFLIGACPCVLGYYIYTGFTESILLLTAIFLLVFGLFSRIIMVHPEAEKKIKMFFFYSLVPIFAIFAITKIDGETIGDYSPIVCTFIACMLYFFGHKCKNSS